MKIIEVTGIRPNPSGKGKGSEEFDIDPIVCSQKISETLNKLK